MVDSDGFIRSSCVSKWYTRDGSRVPHLLKGIDGEVASLTGDKGYDQNSVYRGIKNKSENAKVIIHPRSNAVISGNNKWTQRDRHVQKIIDDGIYIWRRESGYYATINKARWRIRFIDTKQRLEGDYGQEQKKGERLK